MQAALSSASDLGRFDVRTFNTLAAFSLPIRLKDTVLDDLISVWQANLGHCTWNSEAIWNIRAVERKQDLRAIVL